MENQLARRNLNDFQRIELVRKCEVAVKAQAKARQATSTGGATPQLREKLPEAETGKRATDELGAMAGVSRKTYEHAVSVLDEAPEPVIEATRRKELSINAAYEVTKLPEEQRTEIAERIAHGEHAKRVIADVKASQKKYEFIEGDFSHSEELVKNLREKSDENCVLFLWIKGAEMSELNASNFFDASGFRYSEVCYVWMKAGFEIEVCVICIKNRLPVLHSGDWERIIETVDEPDKTRDEIFDVRIKEIIGRNQLLKL